MPDPNPSNAPDDLAPDTQDIAAKQVENAGEEATPGGGGLGGASAADPLGGSTRAPAGASPNSPIDVGVSPDAADEDGAEREAQLRALADDVPEPHPGSQ